MPTAIGEPLAEAAVLGCVLRGGNDQALELLSRLTEDDWTVPAHAQVAAAAAAVLQRRDPVDPVTVLGELRRQGSQSASTASKDAGVLLIELCQAAPAVHCGAFYLRIVLEHSYRRRAQQAALRLLQACDRADLTVLSELVSSETGDLIARWRRLQR